VFIDVLMEYFNQSFVFTNQHNLLNCCWRPYHPLITSPSFLWIRQNLPHRCHLCLPLSLPSPIRGHQLIFQHRVHLWFRQLILTRYHLYHRIWKLVLICHLVAMRHDWLLQLQILKSRSHHYYQHRQEKIYAWSLLQQALPRKILYNLSVLHCTKVYHLDSHQAW